MSKSFRSLRYSGLGCALLTCMLTLMGGSNAQAQTVLSDTPVYSASNVPANLMMALSVEFPTGTVAAYGTATGYTKYTPSSNFLGYFDPAKCYTYSASSPPGTSTAGYFVPHGAVNSSGGCSTTSGGVTTSYWSGNMLNWALMTALDEFRQALTGGTRVVDTTSSTVLIRSNLNSQSTTGNDPNRHIDTTDNVAPSTVIGDTNYSSATNVYLEVAAQGTQFIISNNSTFSNSGSTNKATTYNAEVQVCNAGLLESNCNSAHATTDYVGAGQYNKPEGLIQQNYTKIRVGASAYVFQQGNGAANGTVRALLRDNGPTTYNGYGARQTNTYSEWNATTGIFATNPDTDEAVGTAPGKVNATATGAINYLNNFGYANGYETYDTIADLYWATLAYYMQIPLDSTYTTGLSTTNSLDTSYPAFLGTTGKNGQLNDPVQYTCQSNAIVTIGDAHTWYDTRVPSSGGPSPSSASQAALAVVNGADAGGYATQLGNLPLIEKNGATAASVTMAQLRYQGSSATTATDVPAANQLGLTTEPDGTTSPTYNMAGLAYFAHTQEIRPDLNTAQNTFKHTVTTYTLDVLEPGSYDGINPNYTYDPADFNTSGGKAGPNMYWLAAKYGGFNDINGDGTPASILTWHTNSTTAAAFNLRPDNYFPGNQPALIQSGLQQIFNNVSSTASQSASAPAVTATRALTNVPASTTTGPFYSPASGFPVYTTQYTPVTWNGDVSGYVASAVAGGSVTAVTGSVPWHAQIQLDNLTQSTGASGTTIVGWTNERRIVTWNGTAGTPFHYTNLSATEQTAINSVTTGGTGTNLVNYLRGDKSNEGTDYRVRSHIMGDIVNSQAVLVQNALSPSYTESTNPGYTAFSTSVQNRQPVVYVGSNDGMLHAFEGDFKTPTSNPAAAPAVNGGGSELFAYVPSLLYAGPTGTPLINGLPALANLNGVSTNNYSHHYYVDQTPQVADVDFTLIGNGSTTPSSTTSTAKWHTMLVGGLGKGGMGIYALDITNVPDITPVDTTTTTGPAVETSESGKVLWEFTDPDMGYSYGAPLIVKTRKYGWVVLMTSGYDNTGTGQDGHGILYVLNAKTGALIQKMDTGAGSTTSPAGLTQATGYTQNTADGTIEQVYAGDLLGNVWRFDLSETALDSTGNVTPAYPAPVQFATLTDSAGNAQPITTAPRIELSEDSTGLGTLRWVFVGTGKFLDISDLTNTQQQTFYALRDGTGSTPSTTGLPLKRKALLPNTNLLTGLVLSDSSLGWYYDLTGSAGTSGGTERIVISPNAAAGIFVVTWTSLTPSTDPCTLSGNIYATSFSGQSVLEGPANTVVSNLTTNTAATGSSVVQLPNGTVVILYGQTTGLPQAASMQQSQTNPQVQRVNWREILN